MSILNRFAAGAMIAAVSLGAAPAFAATEIQWWHAMGGKLGERVNEIAENFNKSQGDYKVVPSYKGNYTENMTAAIAAFRAKQPPHIVQVFEVGTASMMAAGGAIKPVYEVMAQSGLKFDPKAYLPAVSGYYSTPDGKMLSMPFNSSTPVMFYNKTAFQKAGLDPNKPPKTWPEVGEYAKKTQAAGVPCGFSSQWQTWIQLENFSAWHDVPFATNANGFGGPDTELKFNSPLHVKHIAQLAEWQKTRIFDYAGRRSEGDPKFINGECAMYFSSSGGYAAIKNGVKDFEFGIAMLPYWPDVKGAPQNSIIGGASLWVMQGHQAEDYKGVAAFFNFLSSPEVQAKWHQDTGYLPITMAAYDLSKSQGFYEKNPGTDTSILQITNKAPTENSKGLRMGNYAQIRDVMDEELEAVWSGKKTAQQALDDAVRRGNELLVKFKKTM